MSEELYGRASQESEQGYVPLADPTPPPDQEREYSSEADGLRKAANDLSEARREAPPVIERKYIGIEEHNAGQEVPANRTIEQKRAVRDLSAIREAETNQIASEDNRQLAEAIDQARAVILNPEVEAHTGQQPGIERQPEAEPMAEPQPGMDPEIRQALENPKIRHALETELASVEQARAQYAEATTQAAQVAAAALYANFPEIGGLTAEQLPVALKIMAQENPHRHAQITEHLNHARAIYGAAQQAQAVQRQVDAVRLQNFTEQQDRVFEESIKSEPPETIKQVKAEIFDIADKHYGIGRKEFAHLYKTEPILRSAAFQRVIFDAARYQIAMRGASEAARPVVPTVQRPGVSRDPTRSDGGVSEASQAFKSNPTPKTAAALLRARRSA